MNLLQDFFGADLQQAALIILNLIVIESLLSVDNAAVLATMVMDLPEKQRGRALRIGLVLGYVFRGACLLLAAVLMKILWLKALGGAYLLFLCIKYFLGKNTPETEDDLLSKPDNKLYQLTLGRLGKFWSTVVLVELMDLTFSIDNVFAAVAYVENVPAPYNLRFVVLGVFIGILAMRLVAQAFVKLMEKFPFLETSAFIVLGLLGTKLILAVVGDYFPTIGILKHLEGHTADLVFSLGTVGIFVLPILTSIFFGIPRRK
jgi:YkoY family integral membrane protein